MNKSIEFTQSQIKAYENGNSMFMFPIEDEILSISDINSHNGTVIRVKLKGDKTVNMFLTYYLMQYVPIQKGDKEITVIERPSNNKYKEMTKDLLMNLFDYKDGYLYWKIQKTNSIRVGDKAGTISKNGYVVVCINGKSYYIHRLIYLMKFGYIDEKLQIDHIDGNKENNNIENLRQLTNQLNHFNRTTAKGYYWNKDRKKWRAGIRLYGKLKCLGYHKEESEAKKAYENAKKEYHIIEQSRFTISECIDVRVVRVQDIANTMKIIMFDTIDYVDLATSLADLVKYRHYEEFKKYYNNQLKEQNINRTYEDNDYILLLEVKR